MNEWNDMELPETLKTFYSQTVWIGYFIELAELVYGRILLKGTIIAH